MKPILFNPEMVRAILDGRKYVTRRVMKPVALGMTYEDGSPAREPPYQPGDIMYVRETWAVHPCNDRLPPSIPCRKTEAGRDCYIYRADGTSGKTHCGVHPSPHKWRPSIHMPKEAARLFLRVTDVRVERLQDITEEEAVREGIYQLPNDGQFNSACWTYLADPFADDPFGKFWSADEGARGCFRWLWDGTIKPADRGLYGWLANPWVWVIEFERVSKEEA